MSMCKKSVSAIVVCFSIFFYPALSFAHCDALDGPVAKDAQKALQEGSVVPVLKWIDAQHENEIKDVFNKVKEVRKQGGYSKELADLHFMETLVRLHRAGEGAPFTGIKPEGQIAPVVKLSDKALQENDIEALIQKLNHHFTSSIREWYKKVVDAKKMAETSPQHGRSYVKAYVEYTHNIERLHEIITSTGEHHPAAAHKNHSH